jgi:hypothetical protein
MTLLSDTDSAISNCEGLLEGVVGVSSHEVLQEQLRVGEIGGVILEGLSVTSHESLLQVS